MKTVLIFGILLIISIYSYSNMMRIGEIAGDHSNAYAYTAFISINLIIILGFWKLAYWLFGKFTIQNNSRITASALASLAGLFGIYWLTLYLWSISS